MNYSAFLVVFLAVIFHHGSCCFKINSVADSCECPDIFEQNGILLTEGAGCDRNITCGSRSTTYVVINFKNSELVLEDLANINAATGLLTHIVGEDTGLAVDIFSFFGMICENKEWYVSKYPAGIRYSTKNGEFMKLHGTNGEYDGKKSKIEDMSCASVTA